ncbi:octopamine receptor beta-3R-like [Stylophora pistillata]|uniref:octopamine receptor beta-3R-like n=1 Tax=Stylophora pistillata TaxID=50429 RepID=UPI000C0399C3|nr:octopamine receptor beta-3R-like [Stylophora pistillata]XP_022796089.1 octopamine receptor beta-3R-like [Stylophora pistillata]
MSLYSNTSSASINTTSTPAIFQPKSQLEKFFVFLRIVEILIILTALIGNFLVVYSFIMSNKLRTSVTNYFVVSLAISDLLTSALVMTFKVEYTQNRYKWKHGELECGLYTTMYLLAVPSSVINLCAVTVDRYLVLRMPLRYESLMTPRRAVSMIGCVWTYAIFWACLPLTGWRSHTPMIQRGRCYFVTTTAYNITVNVINFLLPMLFMAIFWALICSIVLQHRERVNEQERNISFNTNESAPNSTNTLCSRDASSMQLEPTARKKKTGKKKRLRNFSGCRYIGIIVALFYFCWLPYVMFSLIANICKRCINHSISQMLAETFLALGFLNSALNPFFYPFHDKRFKEAIRDIWKKLRSKSFLRVLYRKEKVLEMARLEVAVRG